MGAASGRASPSTVAIATRLRSLTAVARVPSQQAVNAQCLIVAGQSECTWRGSHIGRRKHPAAWLRVECGSARVGDRQAPPQAGEIQEHRRRRTSRGDDCEPPSAASKPAVKLDECTEPARVDEAHLTEIDDDGGSALAGSVQQRGTKVADAGDVELALRSDNSWFGSGQCT